MAKRLTAKHRRDVEDARFRLAKAAEGIGAARVRCQEMADDLDDTRLYALAGCLQTAERAIWEANRLVRLEVLPKLAGVKTPDAVSA